MGSRLPHRRGQFGGKGAPIVKYRDCVPTAVSCAKVAQAIDVIDVYKRFFMKKIKTRFLAFLFSAGKNHSNYFS